MAERLTKQQAEEIAAESGGWRLRPTNDETSACLAGRNYDIRGWSLHRKSGAPIENFSSYYWTPPPFADSAYWAKKLRVHLAEASDSTVLEWSDETKTWTFTMWPHGCAVKTWEGEGATEELAALICAVRRAGVNAVITEEQAV